MWRQQDPIPPACDPCKNHREEREYELALRDPNRCFGRGSKEDPLVIWLDRPRHLNRGLVWKHNNFAKSIAKMLGLTHTWIIKGATNGKYVRDADGRRRFTTDNTDTGTLNSYPRSKRFVLEKTDMHIDLRLGTDLYDCRLSARAYVALDKHGSPDRYTTKLARRFVRKGESGQLEFQRWENPMRRTLARRAIGLGPNWMLHANVGPYLDTYRPSKPRVDDAYTSLNAGAPTREFIENLNFVGGEMSDDTRAMVRRCHADYRVYKMLHDELAPMEHQPPERVAE